MDAEIRKPTVHSMKRRSSAHDYSRCGYYHITISVAPTLQQPFGRMAGRLDSPDGTDDAPHVELSAIGRMVEEELRESIKRYYPMLEVQDYVIMPEHLHFLLVAHRNVVSQNGKPTHLGHVIAGFKLGCNKRYWAMTGRISLDAKDLATEGGNLATKSPGTVGKTPGTVGKTPGTVGKAPGTVGKAPGTVGQTAGTVGKALETVGKTAGTVEKTAGTVGKTAETEGSTAGSVLGDSVAKSQLPPLFDAGYCDVMPVDETQLATQRAYIRSNPRSRLLRTTYRSMLQPQRHTVDTAVTINALRGYLERECPMQLTAEVFASLEKRLKQVNGRITCDSYGSTEQLKHRLLPVVCHRKDSAWFAKQKACCLKEAASGAVLVSARIAKGEQEIMDSALRSGYPVVRIVDNGFPEIYHPSADLMDDCAASLLLLLTPWDYQFRSHDENVSVPFCKTMNCIVQAICRMKDDWWKAVG